MTVAELIGSEPGLGLAESEAAARRARALGNDTAPRTGRTYTQTAAIAMAYAMGALRIARHGALVQQANAVESLSNVDVLRLDKTGRLSPKHGALFSLFPVGLPTLALAAWAQPATARGSLLGPVFRFAVPAALTLAVAGFGIYVGYYLTLGQAAAQTAVTAVSVLCGLVLIVVFVAIVTVPPLLDFFELAPLGAAYFAVLVGVTCAWTLTVRWVWRARLLDRLITR
jgi:hypothetical protein